MPSPVWQVELPSFRSGVLSLLAVGGTGRLRVWARQVASGRPLMVSSTEHLTELAQGLTTVQSGRA